MGRRRTESKIESSISGSGRGRGHLEALTQSQPPAVLLGLYLARGYSRSSLGRVNKQRTMWHSCQRQHNMSPTLDHNKIKCWDCQGFKCNTLDDFSRWQSGPRIITRSEVWVENCMVMVISELSTKCPPFEVHGMDHQQWFVETWYIRIIFCTSCLQLSLRNLIIDRLASFVVTSHMACDSLLLLCG